MILAACAALLVPQTQEPDLQAALTALVDLPTRLERAAEARRLAEWEGTTLDQWLAACARFGSFEALSPGVHERQFDLQVGGTVERTTVHLFVPKTYDPRVPAPLLVHGHGTGGDGSGEHRHWQQVAEALGMLVLSPSELVEHGGWSFTARERGSVLQALRGIRRWCNVDENRIALTGISRGGHMTWDLGLRHADHFAALAPLIGGPRLDPSQGHNNLRFLENVAHLPIRDLQGSKDDPLLLLNLRIAFAGLKELGAPDARLVEFPDRGHGYDPGVVEWREFLGAARRNPRPSRVVLLTDGTGQPRSFWVEATEIAAGVVQAPSIQVHPRRWQAMGDREKREFMHARISEATARLDVTMSRPGSFKAKGRHVTAFRLLLSREMLPARGKILVRLGAKVKRFPAQQDSELLLLEFAERFDRTFLPVAGVRVR